MSEHDIEEAMRELGAKPTDVRNLAKKPKAAVPSCPACGAKFQHSNATSTCKACGLPDEVAAQGDRAVSRWWKAQKGVTRPVSRGGSFQRRRRAHGRPRGGSRKGGA